jgi:hypothetical protein
VLVALALCLSTPAVDDAVLAVVPLDGLGVEGALLEKLNGAVRAQVRDLGVRMQVAKADCAGDVGCLVKAGEDVHATRVLAGSVGLAGDEVHVTLRLLDVGLKSELKALDDAAPANQADRKIRAAALRLLAPDKFATSGAIVVTTPLSGAEIVVDGVPRGTTPLFGPVDALAPGRREVEVRYPGAQSWRGFVDVDFDAPAPLDVAVQDGAVQQVPHATAVSRSGAPATVEHSTSWAMLGGAALGVVGLAALAGAAWSYAAAEDAFVAVHVRGEVTAANVAQNENMRLSYGILLPVGAVFVVAGGGLVAISALE